MNRKTFIAAAVITLAIGGAAYWSRHKAAITESAAGTAETVPVDTLPVISVIKAHAADFRETVLVSGSLVAREEILVAPEIEGLRVVELFTDEGSKVRKGQVLARLVSEQLDAQIAQNDASLARNVAAIAQAKSAIVHEPLPFLYEALPLASVDAKHRRFWRSIFRIVRIPGGRYLLGVLARRRRDSP